MMHVLQASLQVIPEKEAQLWWAGKELRRDKKLQDYIGKNEKTKLVVKIQKVSVLLGPDYYVRYVLILAVDFITCSNFLHGII